MHNDDHKATRIDLFSLATPQMRTFHLTWIAFFICFFGWFGIAPLMPLVREDLGLTKVQIGNTIIASVAATVFVRLLIGPLCDRYGPRRIYAALLLLGAIPVMSIGLVDSYEGLLLARLAIGAIGAAFVITQYHTSLMFAPNVVGTANATTAGWGNLGGGVTQMAMPAILAAILWFGVSADLGWRLAMLVPGIAMILVGIAYLKFTQDTPEGNFDIHHKTQKATSPWTSFGAAARDPRVWALFIVYAACFGVELTINNVAAMYYFDRFELNLQTAGLIAGLFGLMNIFARSVGGWLSDVAARRNGLKGRVRWLFMALLLEGLALMTFASMDALGIAVATMIVFSLFVQGAEGATFGIVPFINRKATGSVAGIVGAGGNAGAVAAGFLFRAENLSTQQGLFWLGAIVTVAAFAAFAVRFSPAKEREESERFARADSRAAALSG